MKAALICIAKRENRYIREWCEYHKRIGFDDIFIYDNNEGDERIRDVVGDLPYVRIDERYRNKRQVNVEIQLKCYNEWYAAHRGEYTHFAFFDVDEYLNISPEYKNLQDFIAHKFGIADGMKIFWKCHGDNGHLRYEDKPLHERFPEISEPKDSRYFYKMIFSTKREDFKMINVHYSTPLTHIVDVNGCRIKYSQTTYDRTAIYGKACIDHYITKSTEEFFMNKRGRKDDAKRLTVNFYYNYNERTPEKDALISKILEGNYTPKQENVIHQYLKMNSESKKSLIPQSKTTNTIQEKMTPAQTISNNNFVIDKIDNDDFLKCKNKIHVLIVNYKQLKYTQHIISNMLTQKAPFDLTVFEQKCDEQSKKYLKKLQEEWCLPNCELNVIFNSVNAPLNHVWNWFYAHTNNKYLAFLNNDIEICNNFISDAENIFDKEQKCGIIIHPTNKKEYTKRNDLVYEKVNGYPVLQGWDFIINRNAYSTIPSNLWIWRGDVYLMSNAYSNGWEQFYDISSPVLHYASSTVTKHKNDIQNILLNDMQCWKRMNLKEYITRSDNKYLHREFNGSFPIDLTKRVIVSFTTWKKRISNVPNTLKQIMNQTKKPDLIILNLSSEEFNGCEKLLEEVFELEKNNPIFKINIIDSKNTKVWKKWIPIIDKYNNDLIIPMDDDIIYPIDFIERLYNKWLENPYNPITGADVKLGNYLQHHCGAGSLIFRQVFGIYMNDYEKLMDKLYASDAFYTCSAYMNGYDYIKEGMNVMKFKTYNELYSYTQTKYKQLNKAPHLCDFDFLNNYYQIKNK